MNALYPGRPYLTGTKEEGLIVRFRQYENEAGEPFHPLLISVVSEHPGLSLSSAFDGICISAGSTKEVEINWISPLIGKLGWCTWNAFYRSVSCEKVKNAFDIFYKTQIPIRFCILDDGWQRTLNGGGELFDWQTSLEANDSFPDGFRDLIQSGTDKGVEDVLSVAKLVSLLGGSYILNRSIPSLCRFSYPSPIRHGRECRG